MDSETKARFARAVCEKERTRKEYVKLKRQFTLLQRRVNPANQPCSPVSSGQATPEPSPFQGTPRRIVEPDNRRKGIVEELRRLASMPANRRRFSFSLIVMALSIYVLSGAAYNHIRNFLPLPSRQTLEARSVGTMKFDASRLQNVTGISAIANEIRARLDLNENIIHGILAVDAISLNREMTITPNGLVKGSLSSETVMPEKLEAMHKSFKELEKYWVDHKKSLISDAFLFQFQPVNASIKSFVVHIAPSTQGKATERTVELLDEITTKLEEARFNVVGWL